MSLVGLDARKSDCKCIAGINTGGIRFPARAHGIHETCELCRIRIAEQLDVAAHGFSVRDPHRYNGSRRCARYPLRSPYRQQESGSAVFESLPERGSFIDSLSSGVDGPVSDFWVLRRVGN